MWNCNLGVLNLMKNIVMRRIFSLVFICKKVFFFFLYWLQEGGISGTINIIFSIFLLPFFSFLHPNTYINSIFCPSSFFLFFFSFFQIRSLIIIIIIIISNTSKHSIFCPLSFFFFFWLFFPNHFPHSFAFFLPFHYTYVNFR